jgi:hypothetical protein
MKDARASIRDSYRHEVMKLLETTVKYLEKANKEDEAYIVEKLFEQVQETPVTKKLVFESSKLGF